MPSGFRWQDGSKEVVNGRPTSASCNNTLHKPKNHRGPIKKIAWDHGILPSTKDKILELLHDFVNQFLSGGYNGTSFLNLSSIICFCTLSRCSIFMIFWQNYPHVYQFWCSQFVRLLKRNTTQSRRMMSLSSFRLLSLLLLSNITGIQSLRWDMISKMIAIRLFLLFLPYWLSWVHNIF